MSILKKNKNKKNSSKQEAAAKKIYNNVDEKPSHIFTQTEKNEETKRNNKMTKNDSFYS